MLFVLPDGRTADVSAPSARLICDRLWEFGLSPGAATAAARISDALHTNSLLQVDIAFSDRELMPLLVASEVAPPQWSLANAADPPPLSAGDRERLLTECHVLIDALSSRADQGTLRTAIEDIEHFRDSLRPVR